MGLDIARRPPDRLVQPQRTTIPANAGERRVPAAKRENKECAHNHEGKKDPKSNRSNVVRQRISNLLELPEGWGHVRQVERARRC
jgi:hypothetical protein